MRSHLLALTVPVLLIAVSFAAVIPRASAEAIVYEVSGRVVSDTGAPIEGARVNGYTSPPDGAQTKEDYLYRNADAVTDADGHFGLKLAAGKGYLNVYYDQWRRSDGREIDVQGNVTDIIFTLQTPPPKTARVTGTVVNAAGEPISGAQVSLGYGCCYAVPMGTAPTPAPAPSAADANTTEAAPPTNDSSANASSGGGGTSSSGVVARPIMPPVYDDYATATTGADGRFDFKAYGGPKQITASAKGYAQTTIQVTAVDNETTDVKVVLEKVPASDAVLTGRVLDHSTGAPVANAHVGVSSIEWGRYQEATTDASGTYTVKIVPGWAQVSVNVWQEPQPMEGGIAKDATMPVRLSSPQYYSYIETMKLASGTATHDIKLDPKPKPSVALVGYVVDPDAKKGVPDASVNVWNAETGDWGNAMTDATGSFKILVTPGHYNANAWKQGYLGGAMTFVVGNDATQRVDIILPNGTQKYAPCEDTGDCRGPIMYAAGEKGLATPAPSAPSSAPAGGATASTSAAPQNAAGAADTSHAATYAGSGGGLPPYSEAEAPPAGEHAATSPVPSLTVAGVLAAAALAVLAFRKRS